MVVGQVPYPLPAHSLSSCRWPIAPLDPLCRNLQVFLPGSPGKPTATDFNDFSYIFVVLP